EMRLPIAAPAIGKARCEDVLHVLVTHGSEFVQDWGTELAQGAEHTVGFAPRAIETDKNLTNLCAVRRHRQTELCRERVRRAAGKRRPEGEGLARSVQGMSDKSSIEFADLMHAKLERRHDAEIAAATSQPPEQIRVLLGACFHEATIRSDEIGGDEIIAR